MTVIFYDIHLDVDHKISGKGIDCFNMWELLYADDTLLVGKRARELNILIEAIEKESTKYNLKLNYKKCNYIAMYCSANIKFADGRKMEETMRATYLGGIITHNVSRNVELNNRISIALGTCNKLKLFWRKTQCSIKWKLQIYNAIIVAHLTYGLCTLNLTPALLARLDAFQIRGLRYILGIEHSFYSHVTNEEVYTRTNIALNKGQDLDISWEEFIRGKDYAKIKQIEKISDFVM